MMQEGLAATTVVSVPHVPPPYQRLGLLRDIHLDLRSHVFRPGPLGLLKFMARSWVQLGGESVGSHLYAAGKWHEPSLPCTPTFSSMCAAVGNCSPPFGCRDDPMRAKPLKVPSGVVGPGKAAEVSVSRWQCRSSLVSVVGRTGGNVPPRCELSAARSLGVVGADQCPMEVSRSRSQSMALLYSSAVQLLA
jgi:hypothetical protein